MNSLILIIQVAHAQVTQKQNKNPSLAITKAVILKLNNITVSPFVAISYHLK